MASSGRSWCCTDPPELLQVAPLLSELPQTLQRWEGVNTLPVLSSLAGWAARAHLICSALTATSPTPSSRPSITWRRQGGVQQLRAALVAVSRRRTKHGA